MATLGRIKFPIRNHPSHPVASKGSKHTEDGVTKTKTKPKPLTVVRYKEKDLAKLLRFGAINPDSVVIQSLIDPALPTPTCEKPATQAKLFIGTQSISVPDPNADDEDEFQDTKVTWTKTPRQNKECRWVPVEVPVDTLQARMKRDLKNMGSDDGFRRQENVADGWSESGAQYSCYGNLNDDEDEDENEDDDETVQVTETVFKWALCQVYDVEFIEEDVEYGDELDRYHRELVVPVHFFDDN